MVPYIVLGIGVLYLVGIFYVKESPNFMKTLGKHEKAKEITKYYTGRLIQETIKQNETLPEAKIRLTDFSKSHVCQLI